MYFLVTPKVTFQDIAGNDKTCELGDLLWCHVHTDKSNKMIRNAILYQAKRSSKQPYELTDNGDLTQLELYTNWSEFEYVRSGCLNGKKRHIRPSAPRRGAQYMLIDDRPPWDMNSGIFGYPNTYPIGSCIASKTLLDHDELSVELVNSLAFLSGDPFDDCITAEVEKGWSAMICDLLRCSKNKTFNRKNIGYRNRKRTCGAEPKVYDLKALDGYCFTTTANPGPFGTGGDSSFFGGIPSGGDTEGVGGDGEGGGISLILIETSEGEEQVRGEQVLDG